MEQTPLDFPEFFQKIIVPASRFSRVRLFNILFNETNDSNEKTYTSTLVSRYGNGKAQLPKELVLHLCRLEPSELNARLQLILQDPVPCMKAALKLVENSTLSDTMKRRLIASYNPSDPYGFLRVVLIASVKYNRKMTSDVFGLEDSFADYDEDFETSPLLPSDNVLDFLNWLDNNGINHDSLKTNDHSTPYIKRYECVLPRDAGPVLYFAYQVCSKADILATDIGNFSKMFHLNLAAMTVTAGRISFYEIFSPSIEQVVPMIQDAGFPEADSIIFNIRYDDYLSTNELSSIEDTIKRSTGNPTDIFNSMAIRQKRTGMFCLEAMLHTI